MYVPPIYHPAKAEWTDYVIRRYPLAVLLTNGPAYPFATHCPLIVERSAHPNGDAAEYWFLGHMNRANPHWQSLSAGVGAKLIFSGPNSYITPAMYNVPVAAPTWDFISVHVSGMLYPMESGEPTLDVVTRTVAAFENLFGANWDTTDSLDYFDRIVHGVGAFRFVSTSVHSMFKLSQEKPADMQDRIIAELCVADSGSARDLGEFMRQYGLGSTDREVGEAVVNDDGGVGERTY
ncbi:FMN-binding negative transcriptional regulator [Nocardia brasiliensis]|uniref:FMN-binding negative transcriptional regulator n=1 Tax=Nocardia brasiliensis TaxID=37326 RepID=A0A6G9XXH0_NOCBR|nr:FMN-binding negative transcriptional regulator [Nocardia brasiliensis]QIS05601.1 FMN-binding negative transcriptional regulator [Nocardia brasiliensis]